MSSSNTEIQPLIDWPTELERHREWMRSIAAARLDANHAEDMVQDASLAVLRQNGRPTDPSKIRSWLYQVVVRRCADHLRREIGEERRAEEWAQRTQPGAGIDEAGNLEWVAQAERQQQVRHALRQLPDEERRMMEMKYAEGRSYREMAAEFGVTERVIEYRLLRAKQMLRVGLKELGEDE